MTTLRLQGMLVYASVRYMKSAQPGVEICTDKHWKTLAVIGYKCIPLVSCNQNTMLTLHLNCWKNHMESDSKIPRDTQCID